MSSPSTIIVAFDIPKFSLEQPTKEQLFLDVILLIVMLAGLADGDVSGVLTCGKARGSPTLAEKLAMSPSTFKSTSQSTPLSDKLLLHVNVIFPPCGTTYPPGAGSASADRVTEIRRTDCQRHNVQPCDAMKHVKLATVQTCTRC